MANDGTVDDTKQPTGVMITAEGEWVVAEPDKASWDQYQAKAKVSAAAQEAAARGSRELQERGLECSIDNRLFVDPTQTPCCQTTYCNECITNSLLENDLTCPSCSTENILIDNLLPDEETSAKIREYEKAKAPVRTDKEDSRGLANLGESDNSKESTNSDVSHLKKSEVQIKSPKASTSILGLNAGDKSKKRPAELELKNERTPPGPPAASVAKQSFKDNNERAVPVGSMAESSSSMLQSSGKALSTGDYVLPQGLNAVNFSTMNAYMGLPMQIQSGLFNPAMIDSNAYLNGVGGGWNNLWANNYPQQPLSMSGPSFQNAMYSTAGYNQQNMSMPMPIPMGNGASGMNGISSNGQGRGQFPNQQRNHFNEQNTNDEDSAYFRKPVNPHRHQDRRNFNRPTDYREI